ncbi:MAG: ADP-forming succinate--CoA ligase subunit beta [Immundisolibacterales bacterium]|nr:ADP-forming succinate--CoA ligase subunit beta [Immundisolibacterales bacterium]
MNVHEYQAKELLRGFGVPVPRGGSAFSVDEAVAAAAASGGGPWVVKAQIHAGGRGAGRFAGAPDGKGGVRLAATLDDVRAHAGAMLGGVLVTKQTGANGRTVRRLYVEEGCDIARELYLAMLVDRGSGRGMAMASTEGGMDIEQVAEESPDRILTVSIDPATGLRPFHGLRLASALGLRGGAARAGAGLVANLYRALVDLDASIVEVNPLVVTGDAEVVALDAKMSFDDNALHRHPDLERLRDEDEEDPAEVEASRHDLNYIALDGEIGCMVNGAGLAMATMDLIKLHGSEPANFLDVGGNATRDRVTAAFKIILSDPNVKGILVNIFGGIMRCDIVAEGVVAAAREVDLAVPLVVRLEGTNVEIGKKILAESGLPILSADGLDDAARKVVEAVRGAH